MGPLPLGDWARVGRPCSLIRAGRNSLGGWAARGIRPILPPAGSSQKESQRFVPPHGDDVHFILHPLRVPGKRSRLRCVQELSGGDKCCVCHCLRGIANSALLAGNYRHFYCPQAVLSFSSIPRQAVAHERLPENLAAHVLWIRCVGIPLPELSSTHILIVRSGRERRVTAEKGASPCTRGASFLGDWGSWRRL